MKSNIRINIDGQEEDIFSIEFLYQKEPYPGDHRYRMIIHEPNLQKHFPEFHIGTVGQLLHNETLNLFWCLTDLRKGLGKEMGTIKFFLNSVTKLEISPERIIIEGICSLVLKSKSP